LWYREEGRGRESTFGEKGDPGLGLSNGEKSSQKKEKNSLTSACNQKKGISGGKVVLLSQCGEGDVGVSASRVKHLLKTAKERKEQKGWYPPVEGEKEQSQHLGK